MPRRPLLAALLAVSATLGGCGRSAPDPVAAAASAPPLPLDEAVARLFVDADAGATRALVVLRAGRPIAERYAAGEGPASRHAGGSLAHCVTALLTGLVIADGRLALDHGAPVAAWQRVGDPRGDITARMLLQMRSGLRPGDETGAAEAQPLRAAPGTRFAFDPGGAAILADLSARALASADTPAARERAVADTLHDRLFAPAGLTTMTPLFDPRGTMVDASASARDWAGLGELIRREGVAGGRRLLPRGWFALLRAASPANPAYGGLVWRNHVDPDGDDLLFARAGPPDLLACAGGGGRFVIVVPSRRLVVARLGETRPDQLDTLRARLLGIVRARMGR